ncbi:MAG: transglutaminase family protein [Sneathiella sp.]
MSHDYLAETPILDFHSESVQTLILENEWKDLSDGQKIGAAYDFVRNEILFGYNAKDALSASQILKDGFGQCNTKGTLLMALLRALHIPCRLHGFTIDKKLQRGIVPELVYPIAPKNIIHSWVDVRFDGRWINLEGFILDQAILTALQAKFPDRSSLCAYGAGTECLQSPNVEWTGTDTYIQKTGINQDFGLFDSPDDLYAKYQQLSGLKGWLYSHIIRHWMNRRVERMRKGIIPAIPSDEISFEKTKSKSVPVSKPTKAGH